MRVVGMKDLRDPKELGAWILSLRTAPNLRGDPLSEAVRRLPSRHIRDYSHDAGPVEKYGDPRTIPSTMPNAVE